MTLPVCSQCGRSWRVGHVCAPPSQLALVVADLLLKPWRREMIKMRARAAK